MNLFVIWPVLGVILTGQGLDDRTMPPPPSKTLPRPPSKTLPQPEAAERGLFSSLFARPSPPKPKPKPVQTPTLDQIYDVNLRLLASQNAERARAGLPALSIDWKLAAAAWVQAKDCAGRDVLSHTGSDGSDVGTRLTRQGYAWRAVAENGAWQAAPPPGWPGSDPRTPEWAVQGWLASPGHRSNMLGPYTTCGAAYTDTADGDRYWFTVYARP